jgi:hypothetical protein
MAVPIPAPPPTPATPDALLLEELQAPRNSGENSQNVRPKRSIIEAMPVLWRQNASLAIPNLAFARMGVVKRSSVSHPDTYLRVATRLRKPPRTNAATP